MRPNGVILCHSELIKGKPSSVIMQAITESQEQRIDNAPKYFGEIRYEREDKTIIPAKDIYLYGEVDFSNKDDVEYIKKFDLIDKGDNSNWIYSNFDYDKGCCTTIDGHLKGSPTWDCIKWFKFCYILLGKPKRIIVYKCPNAMIN